MKRGMKRKGIDLKADRRAGAIKAPSCPAVLLHAGHGPEPIPATAKPAVRSYMRGYIFAGLIIGAAIVIATAMFIYFSPYQSCVRAIRERPELQLTPETYCAFNPKRPN
jgi:hypothetical protein